DRAMSFGRNDGPQAVSVFSALNLLPESKRLHHFYECATARQIRGVVAGRKAEFKMFGERNPRKYHIVKPYGRSAPFHVVPANGRNEVIGKVLQAFEEVVGNFLKTEHIEVGAGYKVIHLIKALIPKKYVPGIDLHEARAKYCR